MLVAERLNQLVYPVKMTYEMHGNTLPHLHMHLLLRQVDDPFVGRPVGLKESRHSYTEAELEQLRATLAPFSTSAVPPGDRLP